MTEHIEYATALFSLSEEMCTSEKILEELNAVCDVISENPSYIELLDTPAVEKSKKLSLIDEAFSSFDEILLNLLKILCERRSVRAISGIRREFSLLYDDARGILRAVCESAVALSELQAAALSEKLAKKTGKTVVLENRINTELLGGIRLIYSGKQLDSSLKARLDKLEESFKGAIV